MGLAGRVLYLLSISHSHSENGTCEDHEAALLADGRSLLV